MSWSCPMCGSTERKRARNKYCSKACGWRGIRRIDVGLVASLKSVGLTFAQMENHIPATGPSISGARFKQRRIGL